MSSKKVGKMVTADVDKALANIGSMRPDMKADATVSAAAAPSRDLSFAERFKYARMAAKAAGLDPSKQTFTHNGKTYTTRMAGEGTSKPASSSSSGRSGTGSSGVSAATSNFFKKLPTVGSTVSGMRGNPPATPAASRANPYAPATTGKDALTANIERRNKLVAPKKEPGYFERMTTNIAARNRDAMAKRVEAQKAKDIAERGAKAKRDAEAKKRAAAFKKANTGWEFGAKLPGKAKGGKIDGCAIRGKTRAPIKKGK